MRLTAYCFTLSVFMINQPKCWRHLCRREEKKPSYFKPSLLSRSQLLNPDDEIAFLLKIFCYCQEMVANWLRIFTICHLIDPGLKKCFQIWNAYTWLNNLSGQALNSKLGHLINGKLDRKPAPKTLWKQSVTAAAAEVKIGMLTPL